MAQPSLTRRDDEPRRDRALMMCEKIMQPRFVSLPP